MSKLSKAAKKAAPAAAILNPLALAPGLAGNNTATKIAAGAISPLTLGTGLGTMKAFGAGGQPSAAPGTTPGQPLTDADISSILGNSIQEGTDKINASTAEKAALRKQQLAELSGILATQGQQAYDRARPDIMEEANNQGILRSSGLGKALADKNAQITQDNSNRIATAGLAGYDDQLAGKDAALSREFSLADYGRELKGASVIGAKTAPTIGATPRAGSKAPTIQGALAGGAAGAPGGVPGAIVGGTLGAVGGNAASKGK